MNFVTEILWKDIPEQVEYEEFVDKIIQTCFKVEKIDPTLFYICVILTNPKTIKEYNQKYRNINRETDVLSFPIFEKEELDVLINKTEENSLEQGTNLKKLNDENEIIKSGLVQDVLGDIIISIDRVKQQAEEYGHSFEREFAYMLVHGFYHLRGYDHMVEDEKKVMRQKEENVLKQLNITR